jgi:hypothetical protein
LSYWQGNSVKINKNLIGLSYGQGNPVKINKNLIGLSSRLFLQDFLPIRQSNEILVYFYRISLPIRQSNEILVYFYRISHKNLIGLSYGQGNPVKGSFKKNGSYCYSCLFYSFLWFYWI